MRPSPSSKLSIRSNVGPDVVGVPPVPVDPPEPGALPPDPRGALPSPISFGWPPVATEPDDPAAPPIPALQLGSEQPLSPTVPTVGWPQSTAKPPSKTHPEYSTKDRKVSMAATLPYESSWPRRARVRLRVQH